jgi:hypothetical protein
MWYGSHVGGEILPVGWQKLQGLNSFATILQGCFWATILRSQTGVSSEKNFFSGTNYRSGFMI